MTQQECWDKMVAEAAHPTDLADNVRRFFAILDIREKSDSGRKFAPNYISSCRVVDTAKLNAIITKMKEQSEYGKTSSE